jgi:hypothetical protein
MHQMCAQIEVLLGPASESISRLASRGQRFDVAFLDADKGNYLGYYKQVGPRSDESSALCKSLIFFLEQNLTKLVATCSIAVDG